MAQDIAFDPATLRSHAEALLSLADQLTSDETTRISDLVEEIREAETWAHRSAARHERDRRCYRQGAAFEPGGNLDLDDVALTGADHLGGLTVLLLAAVALRHPTLSLGGLLRRLFASEAGGTIRDWGVWVRWRWLSELYREEVEEFLASPKGRDLRQAWRKKTVTARQHHLIRELARYLQVARPEFGTRGAAFDWIRDQGGNPRFLIEPARPALPALGGL